MKSLSSTLIVALIVSFQTAATGFAQIGENAEEVANHDARIKKLLDQTELKYEIDEDGDFKLLFEYDDGRSHIVFINSQTESYQGLEIREIWAVGYVPPEEGESVPANISENLIRANAQIKLGAWQVQKLGEKEVGVFRAMIAADAGKEVVLDTLRLVGISADEKEAELLSSDDL